MPSTNANPLPAFEPEHPGLQIRDALDHARVSSRQAARAMGVTAPTLGNVLLGRSGITPDMALRLGRYFGNSAAFWLGLQEQHDLWHRERALAPELDKIERLVFVAAE